MSRPSLAAHCAKILGRQFEGEVVFETAFRADTPNGQGWLRLFQYASSELARSDSLARSLPQARLQLEQMMMTGLLFGHSHNFSQALLQPQPAAAPYYVKRAEAYIDANFAEPIALADLALVAGVSARSLQNGFRNFRGMTPMAFLRVVRLQNAHALLLAADPAVSTTTEIALRAGFAHMGEFAALYRKIYGVMPSQTLSRSF
jgi:AraC-like DNA-binding protein